MTHTDSIPQNTPPGQAASPHTAGLMTLYSYAAQHAHSRQWISALLTILAQEEVARG